MDGGSYHFQRQSKLCSLLLLWPQPAQWPQLASKPRHWRSASCDPTSIASRHGFVYVHPRRAPICRPIKLHVALQGLRRRAWWPAAGAVKRGRKERVPRRAPARGNSLMERALPGRFAIHGDAIANPPRPRLHRRRPCVGFRLCADINPEKSACFDISLIV
jgi:hypothetical protein